MSESSPAVVDMNALCERDAIAVGEPIETHVVVELCPRGEGVERTRAPLSVAFVLDLSTSMEGPPIEHVQGSVRLLLRLLDPADRVCVVGFSDSATEVAPLRPLDGAWKSTLGRRVQRLHASGNTNIAAGLRLGQSLLGARAQHERQLIVLLTDGQPNRDVADADGLGHIVAAMRPDITTVALGYGAHHAEDLLARIAEAGAGEYFYIADPLESDDAFARAVGAQGDVVAEAVELAFRPRQGVQIAGFATPAQPAYGPDGLTVAQPDLYAGHTRYAIARLALRPPAQSGPWTALEVQVSYRPAGVGERRAHVQSVDIPVTHGGGELVPQVHMRVLLADAEAARAEARALADRGQFDGAAAVIRALLARLQAAPGYAAGDGSVLDDAIEQLVDERMAYERRPSAEAYRGFKRVTLGVDMQSGGWHHSDRSLESGRAEIITKGVYGDLPPAYFEIEHNGAPAGRARLIGQASIGRTGGNDIVLPNDALSKRHARVVGRSGQYIAIDQKSTNGTYVNGEPLHTPHVLAEGDEIALGPYILRYREGDPPDEDESS